MEEKTHRPFPREPGKGASPDVPPASYLDRKTYLQEWTCYRIKPRRSDYFPLPGNLRQDSPQTNFFLRLLTGRLRTHKAIYLYLMLFFGLFSSLPLALTIVLALRGYSIALGIWTLVVATGVFGTGLLVNLAISVFEIVSLGLPGKNDPNAANRIDP